jgi:hypothetical protein
VNDLADYLLDNYGRCRATECACRKPGTMWLGRACAHWQPAGARTLGELRAMQADPAAVSKHPLDG